MQKKRIKISQEIRELVDKFHSEGKSVLYLVQERKIVGLITFSDPLREEAKDVVRALKSRGKRVILCTGDNEDVASYIAKTLGVDQFYARVFPAEKAQIVKRLREEGRIVVFVGDGVNDSPALTSANVGISLRSGTDIAIEVADVVIGDSLWHLLDVVDVSQGLMRKLSRIYSLNAIANTVGLVGSALGLISPSLSTLINNGSTIALATYALKKIKEV
jgi:Cu2+-exporting ATPase